MGFLLEVFRNFVNLDKLMGIGVIGYVCYVIVGEVFVDNIQFFFFCFYDMQFGLVYNGNLINAVFFKKELE